MENRNTELVIASAGISVFITRYELEYLLYRHATGEDRWADILRRVGTVTEEQHTALAELVTLLRKNTEKIRQWWRTIREDAAIDFTDFQASVTGIFLYDIISKTDREDQDRFIQCWKSIKNLLSPVPSRGVVCANQRGVAIGGNASGAVIITGEGSTIR